MKDERYWPVLGTWLKDTAAIPPDPQQTARKVSERIPETPQVRRRWWLPSLRRTTIPSHSNNQATPIPATNGHTPTVIGRTQSMLSPVKAITAGAIVFALGGAFLIAQPFDQQGGSVPGAATNDPAMAPSFFTGEGGLDAMFLPGGTSETRPDGVVVDTSMFSARWATNDPRIDGLMTNFGTTLDYREGALTDSPTGLDGAVASSLVRVVNDDGAWEGTLDFITSEEVGLDQGSGWLVGGDAYEGLMAYVVIDYNSPCCKLSGHITPEGQPSAPEAFPEQ